MPGVFRSHCAVCPPSITSSLPVTKDDSSDAGYYTPYAMPCRSYPAQGNSRRDHFPMCWVRKKVPSHRSRHQSWMDRGWIVYRPWHALKRRTAPLVAA